MLWETNNKRKKTALSTKGRRLSVTSLKLMIFRDLVLIFVANRQAIHLKMGSKILLFVLLGFVVSSCIFVTFPNKRSLNLMGKLLIESF